MPENLHFEDVLKAVPGRAPPHNLPDAAHPFSLASTEGAASQLMTGCRPSHAQMPESNVHLTINSARVHVGHF